MADLTKAQINLIAHAYKKQSQQVRYSVNWQHISHQYDVGEVDGANKRLYLSANDHSILREMVSVDYGLDVLNLDFDVDRHQMSLLSHKEKYANIRPEANYVLVKQLCGYSQSEIPATQDVAQSNEHSVFTHPKTVLAQQSTINTTVNIETTTAVLPQELALLCYEADVALRLPIAKVLAYCQQVNITQVIVVENLDSFDCIARMNFDDDIVSTFNNSLFVYRGGGAASPAGCKSLLHQISQSTKLSAQIKVTALTDLDAAGIRIACLLKGCQGLIVPQWVLTSPQDILTMTQINDLSDDYKQINASKYLQNTALHNWWPLVNSMQQYRINVKQQHILTHAMRLTYLARKK